MNRKRCQVCGNREGVALILVIGMLALMTVMGVTFAIFMRTERAAANNFRADIQNRELLQVAMGRALDALEGNVGNAMYPPFDVLQSTGTGGTNQCAMTGSVTNWIPSSVLAGTTVLPQWINAPSQVGGQYSWVVLNCSGLLDVNYAGGGDRASGTNVSEIQLSALSEVGNAGNSALLAANRPYETMQELNVKVASALAGPSKSLVTFSKFPTNYHGGADLGLVDISGDFNALRNAGRRADIINALTRSGIVEASFVYSNLLCYVDPSVLPLNSDDLGSPLTKAVPMINEIKMTMTNRIVAGTPPKCMTLVNVDVELYFPFVKASPVQPYKVAADISVSGVNTFPQYVPTVKAPNIQTFSGIPALPYQVANFTIAAPSTPYTTNDPIQLIVKVGAQVTQGGIPVDSAPYPYVIGSYFTVTGREMRVAVNPNGGVCGFESYDPRFNWDTQSAAQQWSYYPNALLVAGTVSSPNMIMTVYTNARKAYVNGYADMYVAGEPLHNVGELSYLLRGSQKIDKWSTVKLFNDQRTQVPVDRVADNFMVQVSTNRRGLVNVNSRSPDVLRSVFAGLPLEKYPGAGGVPVSLAQADSLAAALMNQSQVPISLMSNYATNAALMDIVDPSGALTPFQRQAVLRESADLFHYRQNYFMILLYSQGAKSINPNVFNGLRAMAEVWRDPVANTQGQHPVYVRSFKILDN